jgi:tetratricopeptide (TPR) repeat protein
VSRIFPALYGQVAYLYVSGQIGRYRELAGEFLELAMAQPEIVPRLIGLRMMGTSLLAAGSIAPCMDHLEQAWALFDPKRDAESALVYGQDLGTGAASYLCIGSAIRGFPEKSRIWGQKAVARGRDIQHVNTLCYALLHGALAAYVSGDRPNMELHLDTLKLLTDEHDVPVWRAGALPLQGLVLGWQGRPQDGLMLVAQGIEMMAGMQFKLFQSTWSLVRAELLSKSGQAEEALVAIEAGLAMTAQTGELWGDAEMHRVRGELLVSLSRLDEAEAAFTTSLAIAREQGAKWWELRAATSLARLLSLQDKRAEAHELLAEIHGWFREGFETPSMMDARHLLDELT